MSRIRTIKPEFWSSEQIVACSRNARLLFIGLWNFCDDAGVHPASCLRLKMEVFPAEQCTEQDIKGWVNELIEAKLLIQYVIEGKSYWQVTGWKSHQRIDKPTYRHPPPKVDAADSLNPPVSLAEQSESSSRIFGYSSATDRNGMDGSGKEDICEVAATSHVSNNDPKLSTSTHKPAENDVVLAIFQHWQRALGHPRAVLDRKRRIRIENALKLGYSQDDLIKAIDGCALTPFNIGQNDRGQRYDDLELILRDSTHIERFIENALTPPTLNFEPVDVKHGWMEGAL